MGLKDKIKALVKEKKDLTEKLNKIENYSYKEAEKFIKERAVNNKRSIVFKEGIVKALGNIDNYKKALKLLDTKNKYNQEFEKIMDLESYKTAISKIRNSNSKLIIPDVSDLSLNEVKEKTKDLFANEEHKKILNETIASQYRSALFPVIEEHLEESLDKLSEFLNEDVLTEIENDFDNFNPININERKYTVSHEKEINELANSCKTGKEREAIEYIKNNLFNTRSESDKNYDIEISEDVIHTQKQIIKANINKDLKDNNIFKDAIEDNSTGFYQLSSNFKNANKEEIEKEISNNGIKLDDNTKKFVKDSLKKLESLKYYKDGSSLFDSNKYRCEESSKVYAFKNIVDIKNDISKALENKDLNKIVELTEQYKKCDQEMTELMDSFKNIDTALYPGNISLARNVDTPVKYSSNIKEVSMVNGLWQVLGMLKTNDISIDEFIDNPTKTYVEFTKNRDFVKEEMDKISFTDEKDFIDKMVDGSTSNQVVGSLRNRLNNFRGFEFIASLDEKNSTKNYEAYQVIHNVYMTNFSGSKISEARKLTTINDEKLKNFILNPLGDKDYYKVYSDPTPFADNVKKVDASYALERINAFKNSNNKEVKKAIKGIALEVAKAKGLECKEYSELCAISGKMGYKAFKDNMKTNDIALSIRDNYKDFAKDGLNKDNMIMACNYLKILDEQYKKRTPFGQYFRFEGRAEKKLINKIKDDMEKKGITKDDVDNFLKGNKSIDDLTNIVVEHGNTNKHINDKVNDNKIKEVDNIELVQFAENTFETEMSNEKVNTNENNEKVNTNELDGLEF